METAPESQKDEAVAKIAQITKEQWEQKFKENPNYPERARIEKSFPDLEPSKYFKYCKRLKIGFANLSNPDDRKPYSAGKKRIYCTVVNREENGDYLDTIFIQYLEDNCELCTQRAPRSQSWVLSLEFMKDMSEFFDY